MKAGETIRGDYSNCHIEFEVTLEPKAKDNPREAAKLKPISTPPQYCPFCGDEAEMETDE